MTTENRPIEQPLALTLFTRQFATLIDAGLSLVHTFQILEQEAPEPYPAVVQRILQEIQDGNVLSRAMAEHPGLFPVFYLQMIRVGEVAGVLEEALHYLADWLEEVWKWWRLAGMPAHATWLLAPAQASMPEDWKELDTRERQFVLMLFCRALAMMYSAGVPVPVLLEKGADLLPRQQGDALRQASHRDDTRTIHARLEGLTFLPILVLSLASVGEQYGQFDRLMDKAADYYRHELMCELL